MSDQANIDEEDLSIEEILSSIRQIISEEDEDETTLDDEGGSPEEEAASASKPAAEPEESPKGGDALTDKQSQDDIDQLMAQADAQAAQDAEDNPIDIVEEEPADSEPEAVENSGNNEDDDDILELDTPVEEDTPSPIADVEIDMRDLETDSDTPSDDNAEISDTAIIKDNNEKNDIADDSANIDTDLISEAAAAASLASLSKLGKRAPIERADESREGALTLEDMARDMMKPMLKEWLDAHLPGIIEKMVEKELRRLSRNIDDE